MTIQVINVTNSTIVYSDLDITILSGQTVTIPLEILSRFALNASVIADININNVLITDTVSTYGGENALNYLSKIVLSQSSPTDSTNSFIFTENLQTFDIDCSSLATLRFQVTGTWVGTIAFYVTTDGSNFDPAPSSYDANQGSNNFTQELVANASIVADVVGIKTFRIQSIGWDSGSANVTAIGSSKQAIIEAINMRVDVGGSVRIKTSDDAEIPIGQQVMAASLPVTIASDQSAIPIQSIKDNSRTAIIFYATNVAAGATTIETAVTLTKSSGTSSTTSAASFVVTNGKKFRITNIVFSSCGNVTATAQSTIFNLRINTSGTVTTSSTPIILSSRSSTAGSLGYDRISVVIPDGYEITGNGTTQFGVTASSTYIVNAPTWDVLLMGFEY